jgi:hypothetical protein
LTKTIFKFIFSPLDHKEKELSRKKQDHEQTIQNQIYIPSYVLFRIFPGFDTFVFPANGNPLHLPTAKTGGNGGPMVENPPG